MALGNLHRNVGEKTLAGWLPREDCQGDKRRHQHLKLPGTKGPGSEDAAGGLQELLQVFLDVLPQLPAALAQLPKGPHDVRHLIGLAQLQVDSGQPGKSLEEGIAENSEAGT